MMRTAMDGADRLEERPLGELVGELVQDGQDLLREEVRLAKVEIRAEATKAATAGAALGAGAALLHAALLCLAAMLVLVGATFMQAWVSAAIVTLLLGGAGYAAMNSGKRRLADTDPSRAVAHLKEDGRWARETMQSIRSSRHVHA